MGYRDVSLGDIATGRSQLQPGPPQYVNAAVGPGRTLSCLTGALLLVTSPDGPPCAFVRRGHENGPAAGLSVQALSPREEVASRFLADLLALMLEHDVFRGQVITLEATRQGGRRVVFLERPQMHASDPVLPDGVLDRIERHVVGPTRHREALLASERHLSRGLLLWGPPGTGKTHCVRYLTSRLADVTVIILSGASLGLVGAFGALARRLAPAVVVLEDVDVVAEQRTFPVGPHPMLFELMSEMSGPGRRRRRRLRPDDEPPGPARTCARGPPRACRPRDRDSVPDAIARRRLLELYGRGLSIEDRSFDDVVARTDGATASLFKELLRKATLAALEDHRTHVTTADVTSALGELLAETAALTRVLLGHPDPAEPAAPPSPHDWLERFPRPVPHR
jgi:SpoVK/Ycf46/Vps4 family AAA+-type ATPase